MRRALELLFPRGLLWRFIEDAARLVEGISISLDRAKDLVRQAEAESLPSSALETLPEWHQVLGVRYNPTAPVAKQRAMLAAILTASGNSTPAGLKVQLDKEYPPEPENSGLTVTEPGPFSYAVDGQILTETDAMRVGAICTHFAPLHLVPTVFGFTAPTPGNPNPVPPTPDWDDGIIISLDDETNICGASTCGVAVCGAESA